MQATIANKLIKRQITSMDNIGSPPSQLISFCNLLDKNKELQSQVKTTVTPKQIIEIAASKGYEISYKELYFWSKYLTASYFPWSEMGKKWRHDFFGQVI